MSRYILVTAMETLDHLTIHETSTYLKAIHAPRDRAIVLLFLTTGIFLNEITELTVTDIDWKKRTLQIPGKRKRTVPLNNETYDALAHWSQERIDTPNPAFFLTTKGEVRTLETRGIDVLLRKYGKSSGLDKPVNAHMLRNTFAIRLFEQPNVTRKTAKQLLGISTPHAIKRYEEIAHHNKHHTSSNSSDIEETITLPDTRSWLSQTLSKVAPTQPNTSAPPKEQDAIDPDTIFVGRDHTFADIRASLNKGQSILLTGNIGIGKTHLLKHAAKLYGNTAFFITTPAPLKASLLDLIDHLQPKATDKPTSRDTLTDVVA